MKRVALGFFAGLILIGGTIPPATAQKAEVSTYKAQLEAALGGAVVAVERTAQYPPSSLTQVLYFSVNRGGRIEVVPVQVVSVKAGDSYVVQSMYIVKTSAAMAIQRTTQLPVPAPGAGGGGGGGTGTNPPAPNRAVQCWDLCYKDFKLGLIEFARLEVCYFACLLGLPIPPK